MGPVQDMLLGVIVMLCFTNLEIMVRCDMALIEPMHYDKPNVTHLLKFMVKQVFSLFSKWFNLGYLSILYESISWWNQTYIVYLFAGCWMFH